MQAATGFRFLIDRSGSPAFLDADNSLAFRRAEGIYQTPDRAQATVRVIGPGVITEVEFISIAANQWETNILTGEWQALPPNWGFNPASLFDKDIGIQSILDTDLHDLELLDYEELEELPGQLLYVLQGKLYGERLYQLSFGMIGPGDLEVRFWVAPETFELLRIEITDPRPDASEATLWRFDFWDFNQDWEILPPEIGEETNP